VVYM